MAQEKTYSRLFVVLGVVLLLPVAIVLQLIRVQFVEGDELRKLWSQQAVDYIPIPAQRGNIYDRQGRLLVSNSTEYDVAIDPHFETMNRARIDTICAILARTTKRNSAYYKRKITSAPKGSRYVVLARNLKTEAYEDIYTLKYKGVILEEKFDRVYGFQDLAAQTLGYVNHQERGMMGLEAYYNKELKGRDGTQKVRRDRNGNIYAYVGAAQKKPQDGHSLHLTLDAHIQAIVEEELKEGIKKTYSSYGTAIVMDPGTGAVRAMANYPTFNPNKPGARKNENRRNYAISDQVEPGSTFKLVTAVAALEQNVVNLGDTIRTPEDGQFKLHGLWLRDHDPLGDLTFKEVIQKSSNIGTAKVAMRLSKDSYYQYVRNMGFGTPTNIDLPNEEGGKLKKPHKWSMVTLPWMAHGYEIQTTPLQILQAYAAFANSGEMMRPYLVEKVVDNDGEVITKNNPLRVREVADKSTFNTLLPVFESVLADSGTAPWARVEGLRIAGKTGTAKKVVEGRYTSSYRASFVGFFPADDPKYAVLVMLDEPKTSVYGGYTAGPIFRDIASRLTSLSNDIEYNFPEDSTKKAPLVVVPQLRGMNLTKAKSLLDISDINYRVDGSGTFVTSQSPNAAEKIKTMETITLHAGLADSLKDKSYTKVPDVVGLPIRKGVWLLQEAGLKAKIINSGTILGQFPKAGAEMKPGRTVTIRGAAKSMKLLTATSKK